MRRRCREDRRPAFEDTCRRYEHREFKFAGRCGDHGFLEDYVAKVNGDPIGCVVLITRNTAGQTQHVVASYRPLRSLLFFSRLLREKFAGTPIADHFAASESSSRDAQIETLLDVAARRK